MPFYSWFRLFFLLYLVLPQTQGAKYLYLTYFEPFIVHHETQIDNFIGQTHRRLEQMGLGYMNILVEWIRERILGQSSPQAQGVRAASAAAPGDQGYASYATDLLSRFAMPAARSSGPPTVTGSGPAGLMNILSSAAGAALAAGAASSGSSRGVPASAQAASMPDDFLSNLGSMSSDQKSSFISTQRDRLTSMLRALDKEQQSLDLAYGDSKSGSRRPPSSSGGEFTKSRSQMSFDNIGYDDLHSSSGGDGSGYPSQHSTPPTMRQSSDQGKRTSSGNWVTSSLGGWLGGSPREETRRDKDDRDRRDRDMPNFSDDYPSRGYASARDITETIARSARDYGRDREYE